ncbi:MAG: peptidoglycan DD-metalloendopeptidase family protein [Aquificaceae bacterium]|nr:peptidoglycan DD-metalloendopeptidase family protein [Aquificaceae bacterium]
MKDRITISIVWHDHRKPILFSVRISALKKLALFLSFLAFAWFLLQLWSLWNFMEKRKLLAEREEVNQKVNNLNIERLRLEEDREKINNSKEKLKELTSRIQAIEEYLRKRGIKFESRGSVGGATYTPTNDTEHLSFLIQRSDVLYKSLRTLPTGYPLEGKLTSSYGWRKNPFGKGYEFHTGMDIEAPAGSPVKATADGIVIHTGRLHLYGETVIIAHASGYKTLYAHLSRIEVKEGDRVLAGHIIGRVGSTGRSTGPHLHYEVIKDEKAVNPEEFVFWR